MALSWNEIKRRAIEFQREWQGVTRENAETQTFYNEFFNIFGISRRRVAIFEAPVKKLGQKRGRIDLFWKGMLLVEQKSKGKDLQEAYDQALDYFPNLKKNEEPRYILVSDFNDFELYDLETGEENKFELKDLHKHVHLFGFIAGYKRKEYKDTEPVNIEAAELMGNLYDSLKEAGYEEHDLDLFLVRILFCLFADDTGIFEKDIFKYFIEEKMKEDGSDVGMQLANLFQVLNTPIDKRQKTLDEDVAAFPYINGLLFEQQITIPAFNSKMREALLKCCYFDWSMISPAVFGSLFQSVNNKEIRRNLGAHYTTEKNIMKVISPLFLDDLKDEFQRIKKNRKQLIEFHNKLSKLTFLDPACGCGNFLILSYREIRKLEIEILKELHKRNIEMNQQELDVENISKIDVDNFYGIEIEEFPAKIAEVALWLMDHLMNIELSETFGLYFARIPLKKAAHIICDNALRIDWGTIINSNKLSYILGNPPFVGKKEQSLTQKEDMDLIFNGVKGAGVLDYVTSWYIKAANYIQNTKIKAAFVSTNSISQGEQVGLLWNELFNKYKIKIHFAHKTFTWDSEARGKAHVHVVIIGFACFDTQNKYLFDYEDTKGEPHEVSVSNINPYLLEGKDDVVLKRKKPISEVAPINYGSIAIDDGILILSDNEKKELLEKEPPSKKFIRQYIGGDEFINNTTRWCLWLEEITPDELRKMPLVSERVKKVKEYRQKSSRQATKELANYPTLFGENRQPKTNYIIIPKVSSEKRQYIPIGICNKNIIANGSCLVLPESNLYYFGVLSSLMHMTWIKYIGGRLESRYQYSNIIVYNNFPWPENPSKTTIKKVEEKAQTVLDTRKEFTESTLADLYDPNTMPPSLVKAHAELDKAVDACYNKASFNDETARIGYLFELYDQYVLKFKLK